MNKDFQIDELKNENEYFQNILLNIPGCVYWKDVDGIYLGCNQVFLDMLGLSNVQEVIGKTDKDFCWHKQAEDLRQHDISVIKSGQQQILKEEVTLVNGNKNYFSVIKSPLFDVDGKIIGIVGISIDITSEKKAEELTIRNLKQQKQLLLKSLQAQKNSEVELSLRRNFTIETISGLAHEINQPLSAVCNYASGIEKRLLKAYGNNFPEDIQNALKQCICQARRAGDIIHSFKNSLNKNEIYKKPYNINTLIKSCCDLFSPLFDQHAIGFEYHLDKILPKIKCDKTQITQVFYNLIINAKDSIISSNTENKTIIITTAKYSKHNIIISIQDFGSGIKPEITDKIFLPFFTSKEQGTGIGLSLAYTIAQRHSGNLLVESVLGKGATFNLVLPI